jgi:hypothetical protein
VQVRHGRLRNRLLPADKKPTQLGGLSWAQESPLNPAKWSKKGPDASYTKISGSTKDISATIVFGMDSLGIAASCDRSAHELDDGLDSEDQTASAVFYRSTSNFEEAGPEEDFDPLAPVFLDSGSYIEDASDHENHRSSTLSDSLHGNSGDDNLVNAVIYSLSENIADSDELELSIGDHSSRVLPALDPNLY